MKRYLLLPALLAMFRLQAQQIEEYRYWVNDDPAAVTVTGIGPDLQVNLLSDLVLPALARDYNTITIQFKDTNDVYSVPVSRIFTRSTGSVTGYEYWIDDDIANRVAGALTAGTVVNLTNDIPLCLTAGTHVFAIRFSSASGTWSVPITRQFTSAASPDTDGDGLCDALDPCPVLANVVPGQSCDDNDACTINDVVDANCACVGTPADADNDGTADCSDGCPADPNKQAPGACGCGVADVPTTYYADVDGDGFGDAASPLAGFTCAVPPGHVANSSDNCPAVANPDQADANNNGVGDACEAGCTGHEITVRLRTDNNPSETAWIIYNASNTVVAQSLPYIAANTVVASTHCLPLSSAYHFTLNDGGGDGINSGGAGWWQLWDAQGRTVLGDNGAFTSISPKNPPATAGYSTHAFSLPLGPSVPWTAAPYAVCGNFTLGVQSKVRCTTVPGSAAYQWEFSDPNQGYRRRVSAATNQVLWTSMGGTAPPLGVTYFVRNRADQGAAGFADDNWGAGCEMAWAASSPAFCTSLIATPGNTFSCGATRTWGGSSRIWAQPVVGAVPFDANADGDLLDAGDQPYAYHFRITRPGYVKDAWSANYILPLNWTTLPMTPGVYTVAVEVQVGGVWRGFCSSAVCTLTIAGTSAQLVPREAATTAATTLRVWPNPNRGDRLHVNADELGPEATSATIDLLDLYGRPVMAPTVVPVSAGMLNTALPLTEMASGLYMVRVTVGERSFVQRLVID